MLESKTSQFTLSPKGEILWQEKQNNPLPGEVVAVLQKGAHALKPVIKIEENEITSKYESKEIENCLNGWVSSHIKEILEPLALLELPQGVDAKDDPVSVIAQAVYDGLGIVPREELEDVIAQLTTETRVDVRAKKIRLGPILVFIPSLNKPAAVRLRALLWSIYNDQELPAKPPADGIVSCVIEDENANPVFYRSIGYPLYGGRAVRIDMLDRVISCVYDHADKGKFQARHEMAEWLGCSIENLYKILESMGHTKIHDPAEEQKDGAEVSTEKRSEPALQSEEPVKDEGKAAEDSESAAKKEPVRPELATFRLKKGKAFEKRKSASGASGQGKVKSGSKADGSKHKKKSKSHKKPKNEPRVISIEAKKVDDDSPFAILQQLKK